jgi:hypothetical protein
MKHLRTVNPEAAASMYKPQPSGAAAPTSTNLDARGVLGNIRKLTLQGDAPKREAMKTPSSPKLDNQNLGFHPERPS